MLDCSPNIFGQIFEIFTNKITATVLFGTLLFPYTILVKKVVISHLEKIFAKRKTHDLFNKYLIQKRLFYLLLSIFFIFWNSLIETSLNLSKSVYLIKDITLATYTAVVLLLFINSIANTIQEIGIRSGYKILIVPMQVGRILSYCFGIVLITHHILKVSLLSFVTGLGVTTGVLVILFKDTILGIIASIQMTLSDAIRIDDLVYFKNYDVHGIITNVSPFVVTIKHRDGSISTIPTFALISTCIKNFRNRNNVFIRGQEMNFSIHVDTIKNTSIVTESNNRDHCNISVFKNELRDFIEKQEKITHISTITTHGMGDQVYCKVSFSTKPLNFEEYSYEKSKIIDQAFFTASKLELKLKLNNNKI